MHAHLRSASAGHFSSPRLFARPQPIEFFASYRWRVYESPPTKTPPRVWVVTLAEDRS